jgi:mono/diheme cytochrome c family protein
MRDRFGFHAFSMSIAGCVVSAFLNAAYAQDEAAVAAGEAVYDEHCAMCHGEKLRSAGAIPDLRNLRPDQRAYFDQTVTDGKGQMPSWGGVIGEQELAQLWAYIRAHAR